MSPGNPFRHHIALWARFRDDIYCAWTSTLDELLLFHQWLNQLELKFTFTIEHSREKIVFLDSVVYSKEDSFVVQTGLSSKLSDTHAYLLPTSCHPAHICKNIPRGVMKRVRRYCSEEHVKLATFAEYKGHLLRRDHNEAGIDEAIKLAEDTPRDSLIDKTPHASTSSRKYPLIMKFNPRLPPMAKFIRQHLHVLELTPETSDMFNKSSLFVSYKMEKNVLSLITRNKFKPSPQAAIPAATESSGRADWGCFSCGKCTMCKNFLVPSKTFSSSKTPQTFLIKSHITCETENIIYMIRDKICPDIFYIGYSEDSMKVRWRNHKSHIKLGVKSCEIASHFKHLCNSVHKLDKSTQAIYTSQLSMHLDLIILESVEPLEGRDMKKYLLEREAFWQATMKASRMFGGLNKRSNR